MGNQTRSLSTGVLHVLQLLLHTGPVGLGAVKKHKVHLAIVFDGKTLHPRHFLFPVAEVGHQAVDPLSGFTDHPAYTQKLIGIRVGAGHDLAVAGGVQLSS